MPDVDLDATVHRDVVLDVLKQLGAFVAVLPGERYSLGRAGAVPEIHRLPENVRRNMVCYLAYKFDVPIHLFWHPDQIHEWRVARAASSTRADPN